MNLDLAERREHVALLAQQIEVENEAVEKLGGRLRGG
jgi:hypothetical protein